MSRFTNTEISLKQPNVCGNFH